MDNDLMARRLRPPSEPIQSKMLPAATQPDQPDSTPQHEVPPAPSTEEAAVSWTPAPPQPETWDALARDAVPWDRPADYVAQTDSATPDQPAWDRPSEADGFDSEPVDDRMAAGDPTSDVVERRADMIDEDQPLAVWSAESAVPDPDDAYAPVLNDVSTPISRAWPGMNGHDAGRNDATVAPDSFVMPPAAYAPVAETAPPDSALAEPMSVSPAVNGEWHESTDSEPEWSQPEATAAPQMAEPEAGYASHWAEPEPEADAAPQWAQPEADAAPAVEAAAQVAEPEAVVESATEAEAVAEAEDEAAAWAELEAEAAAESDTQPEAEAEAAAQVAEPEAEAVAEAVAEPDTEPEAAAESEAGPESDTEPEALAEPEAEAAPLWPDHGSYQDNTEPAESPGQTSWVPSAVEPTGLVPGLGPTPPAELFGNGPVNFASADFASADAPEWHGSTEIEDTFAVMEPDAVPEPAPESEPSPAPDSPQPEPARVEQPSASWPATPAALPFSTAPVPATARPFGMGDAGAADADRMAPRDPEFEPRGPMPPPAVETAWIEPSTSAQFDDQTGWLDPTPQSQPQPQPWGQQAAPMETVPEPTAVPPWATAQAEPTAVPPWAPALAEPTAVPPWASIQSPVYPPGRAPAANAQQMQPQYAAGLNPVAPQTSGFAPLPAPVSAQAPTPFQVPAPPWSQPAHSADPLAQFASPFAPAPAVPAASPMTSDIPQVATVTGQEQSDLWFLSTEPGGVAEGGKDEMEGREPSPILTGILTVGMAVLVIVLVLVFIQAMTSILR